MEAQDNIDRELKLCREAFAAHPEAKWGWCLHHTIRVEPIVEAPIENRIQYILKAKPFLELATRLYNMRPVRVELPAELLTSPGYALQEMRAGLAVRSYDSARYARSEAKQKVDMAEGGDMRTWQTAMDAYLEAEALVGAKLEARTATRDIFSQAWVNFYDLVSAHEAELDRLHAADWPANTWFGGTIFTANTI